MLTEPRGSGWKQEVKPYSNCPSILRLICMLWLSIFNLFIYMNIHYKKSMSYYFCVISCKQTKSYSYNSDGMTNTLVLVCRLPLLPTLININKLGFCLIRECVILPRLDWKVLHLQKRPARPCYSKFMACNQFLKICSTEKLRAFLSRLLLNWK